MTKDEARALVRRYFEVKAIAGTRPFDIPQAVTDAKTLLSDDEVKQIEQEVNNEAQED